MSLEGAVAGPPIRDATGEDLDALADLETRCFEPPHHRPWSRDQLAGELHRGLLLVTPCTEDGDPRIAAYALFMPAAAEAELLRIACVPSSRRRGLGGALLDAGVRRLAALGVEHLFLEVRADNHAALALYRRRGFASAGRRRAYYGDGTDALILSLEPPRTRRPEKGFEGPRRG